VLVARVRSLPNVTATCKVGPATAMFPFPEYVFLHRYHSLPIICLATYNKAYFALDLLSVLEQPVFRPFLNPLAFLV